jgi:hypothetical protein
MGVLLRHRGTCTFPCARNGRSGHSLHTPSAVGVGQKAMVGLGQTSLPKEKHCGTEGLVLVVHCSLATAQGLGFRVFKLDVVLTCDMPCPVPGAEW